MKQGWTVHLNKKVDLPIAEVRYSKRRTLALVITRDARLLVRAPMRASRASIDAFLRAKAQWVLAGLVQAEERNRRAQAQAPAISEGSMFFFLGKPVPLAWSPGPGLPLRLDGGRFLLRQERAGEGQALLQQWYLNQAKAFFPVRVQLYAAQMGIDPGGIALSKARTRWGSCSRRGVRFSWRLIQAPLEIIDYVVVHELAHRQVANHSSRFWALVASFLPDWRARRRWLKEKGVSSFPWKRPFDGSTAEG
ncbi:MAG: SprT family zinc-dependent metalloprotease [bacterium]